MTNSHIHTDAAGSATTLVGREHHLSALTRALDDVARSGSGRFYVLAGDAGIGKTRLADEVCGVARSHGALTCWGRCWEGGDAPPYWPWIQIVRALGNDDQTAALLRRPEAAPLAQIVPELESVHGKSPGPSDRSTARFSLFDAVWGVLQRASAIRPLVIVFDDLHAADEASLVLLRFFARQVGNGRILALATYREDEIVEGTLAAEALSAAARAGGRITLGGLAEEDVASIFEASVGHPAPGGVVAAVWRATEGNPLFVHEVIDQFAAHGDIHRPDYSMGFRVPRGAREVIAQRIARLPEETRHVLSAAAVLGRQFDATLLDKVTGVGLDTLVERLSEAVASGVLREESALGRYGFSHVLMRETLYEALPAAIRMRMHRDVARAIEDEHADRIDEHVGELAHHYFKAWHAGDVAKALDYSIDAAADAERRTAYEEAIHHYQRALKLAEAVGSPEAQRQGLLTSIDRVERLAAPQREPTTIPATEPVASSERNAFIREGDYWCISFAGTTVRLKDSKGLHYIKLLLDNPGREFHSLEIARAVEGGSAPGRTRASDELDTGGFGDTGPILDAEAKEQYKARLKDLNEDLEEAEAFNDAGRAAMVKQEIDFLVSELRAATGLGGRDRKTSAPAERARLAVTRAIRSALKRIEDEHDALGRHLATTIRTGNFVSYNPDPRVPPAWTTS